MTHDGPCTSATAIDKYTRMTEGTIHFGSQHLFEYLKENQGKVVVNVHGHAHDAAPMDKINNVRVVNPGSLRDGEFAELTLKENADGTWRVAQYNKHFI